MEAQDFLITVAQISIAIAGFSSIVEALSTRHLQHWSDVERFKFRMLLQVAAFAMFFALLPLVLMQLWEEQTAWRTALLIYGIFHLVDIGSFIIKFPSGVPWVVKLTTFIGLTIAGLQIYIASVPLSRFVIFIYMVALVWQLFIAFLGFAMMLYGTRTEVEKK